AATAWKTCAPPVIATSRTKRTRSGPLSRRRARLEEVVGIGSRGPYGITPKRRPLALLPRQQAGTPAIARTNTVRLMAVADAVDLADERHGVGDDRGRRRVHDDEVVLRAQTLQEARHLVALQELGGVRRRQPGRDDVERRALFLIAGPEVRRDALDDLLEGD